MKQRLRILITSDEPWSPVWHTQLHYAHQLSENHDVLYMEPPVRWSIWRVFGLFKLGVKQVSSSLRVIRYFNLLPSNMGSVATLVNDRVNMLRTKSVFGGEKPDIVWHFDPFRSYHLFRDGGVTHLYHVIDPFYDKRLDKKLAQSSDLVIVTSPRFVDYYKDLNTNTMLIQQGVDPQLVDQFDELENEEERRMVLLGSLTDKVNYQWITEAVSRSGMKLLIIGPDLIRDALVRSEFNALCQLPEVEWTGALSPDEYLPLLRPGSLGLIAYRTDLKNEQVMRSPLKVISYISRGMPVLTNIDCEIPELEGPAINRVDSLDGFVSGTMGYQTDGPSFDNKVVLSYLRSRRYDVLIRSVLERLQNGPESNE